MSAATLPNTNRSGSLPIPTGGTLHFKPVERREDIPQGAVCIMLAGGPLAYWVQA